MGDRDGVLKAKTECFEHMMPDAVAVLNADDDKLATVQTVMESLPYTMARNQLQAFINQYIPQILKTWDSTA